MDFGDDDFVDLEEDFFDFLFFDVLEYLFILWIVFYIS